LATVKVFPEPVTPSKVWCWTPEAILSDNWAIAVG